MIKPFLLLQTTRPEGRGYCHLYSTGASLNQSTVDALLQRPNQNPQEDFSESGETFVAVGRRRSEAGVGRLFCEIVLLGNIKPGRIPQDLALARLNECFAKDWDVLRSDPRLKCERLIEHEELDRWLAAIMADMHAAQGKSKSTGHGPLRSTRRFGKWRIAVIVAMLLALGMIFRPWRSGTSEPDALAKPETKNGGKQLPPSVDPFLKLCEFLEIPAKDREQFAQELKNSRPNEIQVTDALLKDAQGKGNGFGAFRAFEAKDAPTELQDIVNSFKGANGPLDFKTCKSIRGYLHRWSLHIEAIRKVPHEEIEALKGIQAPTLNWLADVPQDQDPIGKRPIGPYFTHRDARTAEVLKKWLLSEHADKIMKKHGIEDREWLQRLAQLDQKAGPGDAVNEVKDLEKKPDKLIQAWSNLFEGCFADRVLSCGEEFPFPKKPPPTPALPNR